MDDQETLRRAQEAYETYMATDYATPEEEREAAREVVRLLNTPELLALVHVALDDLARQLGLGGGGG